LPTTPTFIGRFKIVNRIGRGGMGALYLAWDPTLERQIAIKLLREDHDDLRERFAREARSIARLRHPHIVTVFDVGVHEEQPFIAMEYIKGQTLAEIIGSGGPLTIVRKLQLAEQLCDGLAYAHKAGIVHRDIKPANIMVDEADGSLKLLDFGIARVGPGMTQAGVLIGTLSYMSPEQVTGSTVDGRSDIFAVGAVLYELLTRRQAFPGRLDTGVLHKILHVPPEPLEALCADLDPEIIEIVARALEKDPAARYQELTTMRKDLQRVLRRLEGDHSPSPSDEQTIVMADPASASLIAEPRLPTPTPRTPKGTDREALARRRASQIQTLLDAAGKALDAGDHDAVIAQCEEVLLLDSDNTRAWDLRERAKAAVDERQADAWLDEARHQLESGELEAAADLVERALALNPAAGHGPSLVRRIDEARQEQERQRRRLEACRDALNRASELLGRGLFEDAAAAADQALAVDPDYPGALSVKQRAIDAVEAEAKRRELASQRAKDAIGDADRLAQSGDPGAALTLLEAFAPPHPDVERARDALRADLEARRREDERRRTEELRAAAERLDRQRRVTAALERATVALSRQDFAVALEILRPLQKSDPDAAGLQPLIAEAEDLQSKAELARQTAIEVRRQLDAASERLAAGDLADADTHVERALTLDPGNAEAQLLARELTNARQTREREEAIAAAIRTAEKAPSHAIALAALQTALDIDPNHVEARRLFGVREAARQQEQAAEHRRQAVDAACREIETQIAEGAFDAAERTIAAFEQDPDSKKAVKALRRSLKQARAAADKRRNAATVVITLPPETGGVAAGAGSPPLANARPDATPAAGARSPRLYAAAALAATLLLMGGYLVLVRQPAPPPAPTGNAPSGIPAPRAGARTDEARPSAPADSRPDQAGARASADAAPSTTQPSSVRETSTVDIESRVRPLRRLARQQLAAGARPQALATAMSGLELAPRDKELTRVVNDLSNTARTSAQRSRQLAQAAGPAAVASPQFRDAEARQDLAARLGKDRQVENSLRAYWEAADLFAAAAAAGKSSAAADPKKGQPTATPPPAPAVASVGATAPQTPAVSVSAPPASAPPAATTPAIERPASPTTPPAPATSPQAPPPARRPVAPAANEENLIRSTLQTYVQAYSTLDAGMVKRVFPAVDATALAQAFAQMRSQHIEIEREQIAVAATTATVTCQVRQHFEPKAGRVNDSVVTATFALQKTGAGWVIVQRR
jgi:eukaryotic-like serine/threonine-protein kinase